jgi:hypothetical protein
MSLDRTVLPEFWGAENLAELLKANIAMDSPSEISIVDSLAVLQPQQAKGKKLEDLTMNDNMRRAKVLTDLFDSLRDGFWYPNAGDDGKIPKGAKQFKLGHTPCVVILINHLKPHTKNIGGGKTIIENETVGGMSARFHASMRLVVSKHGYEKSGDRVTHQIIKIKAIKNKYGPPQRECELKLSFEGKLEQRTGINYYDMAMSKSLIEQRGAWIYSELLPEGRMQGKDAFNEYVEKTPELKKLFIQ